MTEDEKNELEWLRAFEGELSEQQFNRLYQLEKLASTANPKRTHEQIKADGDSAYDDMNKQIKTERSKELQESYDYLFGNPVTETVSGLLAPSSMESIRMGEEPTWGDIGLDVGLAATTLIPPLKGATVAAPIWRNALLGAGIAGAGEGAMAAMHDRDYNVLSPLVGLVAGGAVGGISGRTRTSAIKQIAEANNLDIPTATRIFDENIKVGFGGGDITEQEANKLYQSGRELLTSPSNIDIVKARNAQAVAKSAGKDVKLLDIGANRERMLKDLYQPVIKSNLSKTSRKAQEAVLQEALDDIKANTNSITGVPDLDIMGSIVERYQKSDPVLSKLLTETYITPEFGSWKNKTIPAPYVESMTKILARKAGVPEEAMLTGLNIPESVISKGSPVGKLPNQAEVEKALGDISTSNIVLESPVEIKGGEIPLVGFGKLPNISTSTAKKLALTKNPSPAAVAYPSAISRQHDENGDIIYAPRGRITWEELMAD